MSRAATMQPPEARVCSACPLVCDDLPAPPDAATCAPGAAAWNAARAAADLPAARFDDVVRTADEALARATAALGSARRVLVAGLADATLEAVLAGCDVAELLGAAIDAGAQDVARPAGPTAARVGAVTADWEELRDRADLVLFWFHDPSTSHPRFLARFVAPPVASGQRRTIAVGPAGVLPVGPTHRHLPLPAAAAVDAARGVEALLGGQDLAAVAAQPAGSAAGTPAAAGATRGPVADACRLLGAAIEAAACVGIVTGPDHDGLADWSVAALVRAVAHRRPAFAVPLAAGPGANHAGAAAVCTWRYGAAGAIARADRGGAVFLPAEQDARRLVTRGEVDAVLAVGRLAPDLEAAIAARGDDLAVVRIDDGTTAPARTGIRLRCTSPLVAPAGTMLRGDGRRIVLGPGPTAAAGSAPALLADLAGRLRSLPGRQGGGR